MDVSDDLDVVELANDAITEGAAVLAKIVRAGGRGVPEGDRMKVRALRFQAAKELIRLGLALRGKNSGETEVELPMTKEAIEQRLAAIYKQQQDLQYAELEDDNPEGPEEAGA